MMAAAAAASRAPFATTPCPNRSPVVRHSRLPSQLRLPRRPPSPSHGRRFLIRAAPSARNFPTRDSPGDGYGASPFSGTGSVFHAFGNITPLAGAKWTALAAAGLTVARAIYAAVFNPAFWMYSSWFFVVWPLPAAVALGIWSLYAASKQSQKKATQWEQVLVLAGALTWLILVPLGLRNGYLEGWPIVLFLTYMYFFLIGSIVRLSRYGQLSPRSEDKQWSSSPSRLAQVGFIVAVVGGHWLAAYEGPLLYFSWNWAWPTRIAVPIIALALIVHYSATYFLGKYFDRLVKPKSLVIFGPYRFIRHPIYASYMLLFVGYCVALRAYWSMAFLLLACVLYYEQRVKLEEELLEEAFGEQFRTFKSNVKYKYFPMLY